MRARWAAGAATGIMLVSVPALADAGAADDVRTLEQQLTDEHSALSTADCSAACRALSSIRRAAERICALEPGPRCDAAREKAADATRRVREACPDCVLPSAPEPTPSPERAMTVDQEAPAMPASEARGGCRSCAATEGSPAADLGVIALATLAIARLVRGRSKKDRRRV